LFIRYLFICQGTATRRQRSDLFGLRANYLVPISAALCQGPHFKVAAVVSRWQGVEKLICSGLESHTRKRRTIMGRP